MYDDSNIINHTVFTELNKRVQSYGLISLEFDKKNKELIIPKNFLNFNIAYNTKRQRITLQLQNIQNPNKIKTTDSKIHNFSILTTKKQDRIGLKRKMPQVVDEFRIEGLQSFSQYTKINPISIQITESEIQNKLSFYSKNYKYKFLINNLLFSSSIQKDTNVIFIKKTSHWLNTVFIDSECPRNAQHFAFAFKTADIHNLLDFSYSLLDDEGKLIKFKDDEEKIPALNFGIKIIR